MSHPLESTLQKIQYFFRETTKWDYENKFVYSWGQ